MREKKEERMLSSIKHKVYLLLEDPEGRAPAARRVRLFLICLILASVGAVILETVEEISASRRHWFRAFELFCVMIFSLEYAARVWVCSDCGLKGRLRHMLSPLMLVDLLAILPFYLPLLLPADLIFLRALRLMRLARVLKLGRYSDAIRIFLQVVRMKKEQLAVAWFMLAIMLVIASSLMYYCEHTVQPAAFASIPHAMWWAVITLTTVGYGDAYPLTLMGRLLAAVIAMLGIGMFAIPAGILSAGFVEYGQNSRFRDLICPHCGKRHSDAPDPDEE